MQTSHGSYNDGVNVVALSSGKFGLNIPGQRVGNFVDCVSAVAHAVTVLMCRSAEEVKLPQGHEAAGKGWTIYQDGRALHTPSGRCWDSYGYELHEANR